MAKIDVIIPFFNTEFELSRCIDSVINQTFKDIAIIVVNDGSTDGSLSIIEKYKSKDNRIILINQEHRGVGAARNAGIRHSKSEYIFFLDSDDYLIQNALELMLKIATQYNVDAVFSNFIGIDLFYNVSYVQNESVGLYIGNQKYDSIITSNISGSSVWGRLYKNNIFKDLKFIENQNWEDTYIFPYILEKINTLFCSNIYSIVYANRANSITATQMNEKYCDRFNSYLHVINYYKEHNICNMLDFELRLFENIIFETLDKAYLNKNLKTYNKNIEPFIDKYLLFLDKTKRKKFKKKYKKQKFIYLLKSSKLHTIIKYSVLLPFHVRDIKRKLYKMYNLNSKFQSELRCLDYKKCKIDSYYKKLNYTINK